MSIEERFMLVQRYDGLHLIAVNRVASIKRVEPTRWVAALRPAEGEPGEVVNVIDVRITTLWRRLEEDRRPFGVL